MQTSVWFPRAVGHERFVACLVELGLLRPES
jgi:hypothetical protein